MRSTLLNPVATFNSFEDETMKKSRTQDTPSSTFNSFEDETISFNFKQS